MRRESKRPAPQRRVFLVWGRVYSATALFPLTVWCHTCRMRTMVSARIPNDLVARLDQAGPRSAVIVAALRAYLRRKPAPSAKVAGCNKVVQG